MFALNLSKLNINEAELKAFIYQQLNDIQPYIGEEPVAIKMAYTEDGKFVVRMIYTHGAGEVETESSGEDIFNTIAQAKSSFIKSLSALDRAIEIEAEENAIPAVTSHIEKKTVH